MKSINSATVTCGLLNIPVKIYSTSSKPKTSFSLLSKGGNKVCQKLFDSVSNIEIDRADTLKGFEYTKNKFVSFTKDEYNTIMSSKGNKIIEISSFLKEEIPIVYYGDTYYLGPDNSEKAYSLLTILLLDNETTAIASWSSRERESLVEISGHCADGQYGLIMRKLNYTEDVKSFEDIGLPALDVSKPEFDLGSILIDKMTSPLDTSKYTNPVLDRLNEAVQKKIDGKEIVLPNGQSKRNVLSLLEQLKQSLT